MNFDLTLSQLKMIGFVHGNGFSRMQDIADGLEITAPTASVAVNKLVSAGWLEKNPDPEDGRAALISLTSRTKKTFMKVRKKQIAGVQRALSGLTSKEQKTLLELLRNIIHTIENEK